jgi:hypothetical protein
MSKRCSALSAALELVRSVTRSWGARGRPRTPRRPMNSAASLPLVLTALLGRDGDVQTLR